MKMRGLVIHDVLLRSSQQASNEASLLCISASIFLLLHHFDGLLCLSSRALLFITAIQTFDSLITSK